MRNNKPSLKTLETAFPGKGKALRKLLTSTTAVMAHPAAIKRNQECHGNPSLSDLRMTALNVELETYGVEHVHSASAGVHCNSRCFDYCNAGDTYTTTIIRFDDGRYRVGDWGTIVERGNYA